MAKTYLDIINDARDELGQSTITTSRIVDTDVEVKKGRSAIQYAVRDLYSKHLNQKSEEKTVRVTTVPTQAILTNVTTDPWDGKMVQELK